MCRAAYSSQSAARTPHPYILIRLISGQVSKFCPVLGRIFKNTPLENYTYLQSFAVVLGRLGRIGQNLAGFARACIFRGLGEISLTCKSHICALCAPRAPPCVFLARFQMVTTSNMPA